MKFNFFPKKNTSNYHFFLGFWYVYEKQSKSLLAEESKKLKVSPVNILKSAGSRVEGLPEFRKKEV